MLNHWSTDCSKGPPPSCDIAEYVLNPPPSPMKGLLPRDKPPPRMLSPHLDEQAGGRKAGGGWLTAGQQALCSFGSPALLLFLPGLALSVSRKSANVIKMEAVRGAFLPLRLACALPARPSPGPRLLSVCPAAHASTKATRDGLKNGQS
ncbi:unnamed protein product [Arctogadus glacialis]